MHSPAASARRLPDSIVLIFLLIVLAQASSFSARHMATRIGTKGMYSSAMPTVDEPSENSATAPATSHSGRAPSRAMAQPITASMAPVARTTRMTPPTRKTKKMISWAAARPAGMAVRKVSGGSGSASTAW